jgi:DNA polymerase I-like protein with 3'-5' exonuclease and polymerase domains
MKNRLTIVRNWAQLDKLIEYCQITGYASIDFETTGLKYKDPAEKPLILGVSFQPGSSWIIPLAHEDSPFKKKWVKVLRYFGKKVMQSPKITKVAWNFKFEYKWFMSYGIFCKGRLLDGMLAKYLLDEERPHDLKTFVRKMFPDYAGYEQSIRSEDGTAVNWRQVPFDKLCKYCGIDTDLTLQGMIIMEPKLIKYGFYSMFRNMLMMATRVLAEAEYFGMLIDRPYLEKLMITYAAKIAVCQKGLKKDQAVLKYERAFKKYHLQQLISKVELEIAEITRISPPNAARLIANREIKIKNYIEGKFNKKETWEEINFGSPTQIRNFLFEAKFGLRLKPFKFTKNKKTGQESDNASTDEESLIALAPKDKTGFMKKLLGLRELEKLNSTYIEGMYKHLCTCKI